MKDKQFDDLIGAKLKSLNLPYAAGSWRVLDAKLDAEEVAGQPLSDENFDQIVADRLQEPSIMVPADWDRFSEKLDDAFTPPERPGDASTVFDTVVKTKMTQLDLPYRAESWRVLVQRMESGVEQYVLRSKLSELALMLLIFLTFGQFLSLPVRSLEEQPIAQLTVPKEASDRLHAEQQIITPISPTIAAAAPELNRLQSDDFNTEVANKVLSLNTKRAVSSSLRQSAFTTELSEEPSIIPQQATAITTIAEVSTIESESERSTSDARNIEEEGSRTKATENQLTEEALTALETSILPVDALGKRDLSISSTLAFQPDFKWRLSIFGATNLDHIYTPKDNVLFAEAYDRYALSYGGGVGISRRKNRWEVGTGLIYSSKYYQTIPVIHIYDGSVEEGEFQGDWLTAIEMDIITLPFNISYDLFGRNRWRVYGKTGGSYNLLMRADYVADQPSDQAGNSSLRLNNGQTPGSESSRYNKKEFTNGWLADRNYSRNDFLTLDAGFGLERYLNSDWSVFLQPTYRYNLGSNFGILDGGIGPNHDRISTVEILLGVKVGL